MKKTYDNMPASTTDNRRIADKLRLGKVGFWEAYLSKGRGIVIIAPNFLHSFGYADSRERFLWPELTSTLVHPADRSILHRQIDICCNDIEAVCDIELRIWNQRKQHWSWVYIFGNADSIDPELQTVRLSGCVQDIDNRIHSSTQAANEHSLNQAFIDKMPDCCMVVDAEWKIIRWNSLFVERFNPGCAGFTQDDAGILFTEASRQAAGEAKATALDSGYAYAELVGKHADGTERLYRTFFRRMFIGDKPYLTIVLCAFSEEQQTAREQASECLHLASLVKAAELGTWEWNIRDGKILCSERWAEVMGESLEAVRHIAYSWEKNIHPDDLPQCLAALHAHWEGKTAVYEAHFRIRRKDGEVVWAMDRGRILERDRDGNPVRMGGILQDITSSKTDKDELAENTTQLESAMQITGLAVWDWHLSDNTMSFNSVFFSSLGYAPGELPSTREALEELMHPEDLQHARQALQKHFSGNCPGYGCEIRLRHKDGRYIWVRDLGRIIERDENKQPVRMAGGLFSIDERKKFEAMQQAALDSIAEQKHMLEKEVAERTSLLHLVTKNVEDILAASGLTDTPASKILDEARQGHDVPPADFSQCLEEAFALILTKMWWYKSILDSIPFPISVMDMENRWTYLNAPALEAHGIADFSDVAGKNYLETGSDIYGSSECRLRDPEHGNPTFSVRHPRFNRSYQGQASYLYDGQGNKIGHIEVMQDVTQVRMADERMRIMLDSNPLACNFWDADLNNLACNLAAAKLFDFAGKKEYLEHFPDLSPQFQPNGRLSSEAIQQHMRVAFATGFEQFEWMHQKLDGTLIPCEVTLIREKQGDEYILSGYTRDLRELKMRDDALDKERRLLRKVMDSSPVCFVILVEGKVRFATPHAMLTLGIDIESKVQDFFCDIAEQRAFFEELRVTGAVNWRVVTVQSSDGTPREMLANAFLADYYGEPCVMSWFLDVTDMREKERELRLARDAAEQSARAKSDFLANMSHEIRTPMNAVLGMTRLVLDTSLSERQRDFLQKAEFSAKALLRILDDILDFSKIEAGKLVIETVPFSLLQVMQSVIGLYKEQTHTKGLGLALDIAPEIPDALLGDPYRLSQVLTNLISNAIKFTERGGVSVSVSLHDIGNDSITVAFAVKDTGIGLAAEKIDLLFAPFSQADTSTTRRYGGTGLGLTISRQLTELMRGEISCSSRPGEGTTFTLALPFALAESDGVTLATLAVQKVPAPPQNPEQLVAHLRGKRLLVVEDNEINQLIAQELLEDAGFVVDLAGNGLEAIERLQQQVYDLVFMDIQMPEMDGLTAVRHIRTIPALFDLPIIAMTAHAMVGDREKSLAVGMNDHITKPINPEELFSTIARWLPDPAKKQDDAAFVTEPAPPVAGEQTSSTAAVAKKRSGVRPAPAPLAKIHPNVRKKKVKAAPMRRYNDEEDAAFADCLQPTPALDSTLEDRLSQATGETKILLPLHVAGIDIAAGIGRAGEDDLTYSRALFEYYQTGTDRFYSISDALLSGEMNEGYEMVGKLLQHSHSLGIRSIGAVALELRAAINSNDYPLILKHLGMLETKLESFKNNFENICGEEDVFITAQA